MLEIHPFGDFIPEKVKYLMIGSFVTKPTNSYEWYYANGRNQFWPIMEAVYNKEFDTKEKQQELFKNLGMALSDIIYSCERKNNSNLDNNLINLTYNIKGISDIINKYPIEKIYLTSRNVENKFRKQFKEILVEIPETKLITLPSPSPRYAVMSKLEKIQKYKELLPML